MDSLCSLAGLNMGKKTSTSVSSPDFKLCGRAVDHTHPPLVIAEIGINHEGDPCKARRMVDDALSAGCECVKFQSHVIEDEMIPNEVIPGNARESIWQIMSRCALSADAERELFDYVVGRGLIYLSTPFSRAAADRLEEMGVGAYKIGSGECNNYPLIRHIAKFGKPVILSTGMNDLASITPAVEILRSAAIPFALLHCVSIYPTPYSCSNLGALATLSQAFPGVPIGLSDHSLGIYTCLGAVALGACILEKHFTSDKTWPGPDIPFSLDPRELRELILGTRAVFAARNGDKRILPEEQPTIAFAYASVVTIKAIDAGQPLTTQNLWVKRPGTGEILARDYERLLGRRTSRALPENHQLRWDDVIN